MDETEKKIRSIIGHTRTIRTAVLVCEFLRTCHCKPHSAVLPHAIGYEFTDPTPANGQWSAIIFVHGNLDFVSGKVDVGFTNYLVDVCRAFVAGAGEIW